MLVIKRCCFFIILIPLTASGAFAGAWTSGQGNMYGKVSLNVYEADRFFDGSGHRQRFPENGSFTDRNLSIYSEYGIRDNLTALGSGAYKQLTFEDDSIKKTSHGFSDIEVGLKYRLLKTSGGVLSVQGLIKIPEAYDKNAALPLGNGQYDTEARVLFGHSLYPMIPGYVNVEAGYRMRAGDPSDEFRYLAEFGADMSKNLYCRIKLDGIRGMKKQEDADVSSNPSANPAYDLGKLDMALGFKMSGRWILEAGYRKDLYGKNISAGANWSLGVICVL